MAILEVVAPTSTISPPWQAEQEPRVRGVLANRITAVSGASVPGSGLYRPSSAMRVELRPYSASDISVSATASASSGATSLTMSTGHVTALDDKDFLRNDRTGEMLRVNGSPSGTTVPVLRGLQGHSSAAAINSGDDFTVPGGDVADSGNTYATSRAECFHGLASPTSTPPASWPHPVGSTRWLRWTAFVPAGHAMAPDSVNWLTTLQIKGQYGGGPPIGIEMSRSTWRLGGTRTNAGTLLNGTNGIVGTIATDAWTDFALGVKLSPVTGTGWVALWINGVEVVPQTSVATMDYQSDGTTPDPVYIKQGIYRNTAWASTHILHLGPLSIADSFGVGGSGVISIDDTVQAA